MSGWIGPVLPPRWSGAMGPAFVGRHHELAALEDVWTAASGGARQVVFVGGEPGAGKSRIVAECCRTFHQLGAAVLVGVSVAELGLPYQPFEEPVGHLRAGVLDGVIEVGADVDAARVAGRLAAVVGGREETGEPKPDARREIYDALAATVRAACRDRPLVIVLEDMHWSGPSALQMLGHLVAMTADARLVVLATHRTTAPDRSPGVIEQIASLYRLDGVQRLDLAPLDTEDIADFLVREGGLPRARARPAAVVLRDRTGGNPFYLRELWDERRSRHDRPASEAIRDMVEQRMAALSAEHREALELAAVIGEEIEVAALLALLGASAGLTALDAIVATGLLEPVPGVQPAHRFVHALTREAVLARLPLARRTRYHEAVAGELERRGGPVQQLAHHYAQAHHLGHAGSAVRYLVAAADIAGRGLAHDESGRLLEQAAGLCADVFERDELLLQAANGYHLACDFAKARTLCETVAKSGSPSYRLAAAVAYEDAAWLVTTSGHRSLRLLEAGLAELVPDPQDGLFLRALAGLSRATAQTGAHDRAEQVAVRAIDLARGSAQPGLLADALAASLHIGFRPASNQIKGVRAQELSGIAREHGLWLRLGPAAYYRAAIAYQDGDAAALLAAREDLARVAEISGQRYWAYMGGCIDFCGQLVRGRLQAARTSCSTLLELAEGFDEEYADGPYGVQSFMLRRELGAIEAVRALVTGDEDPDEHWSPALLALYTELGLPQAGRLLQRMLGQDLRRESQTPRWPAMLVFMVEATLALGDTVAAERLRPYLEEYRGLNISMGPFVAVFGAADRLIGGMDSVLGRGEPGRSFAEALTLDRRTGAVVHEAYTLIEWAAHLRRSGDDASALARETEARGLAEPNGLVRVLARLDSRPDHDEPARPQLRPDGSPLGLTDREVEVLRLLGDGLSNRELARTLTISENTAANHVRNILIKTGCANRTQAAMFASRNGLLG